MKKRIFAFLLAVVLVAACMPPAQSAADIFFVAYNDTIPLTLPTEDGLISYRDILLAPHTVFTVNGMGLTPAYDAELKTMTLYSRTKRLVFNLSAGYVTDESGKVRSTTCAYRNQVVFLPVELCAEHFGFSVSLLTSRDGYRALRFTNGQQSYEDDLFIQKAENLISYRVDRYLEEQGQKEPEVDPPYVESPEDPFDPSLDPDRVPPTVYLAVRNAEHMAQALSVLKAEGATAVFFLTADEICSDPDLVRAIRAADFPIGLTVSAYETDVNGSLKAANEYLDAVIHQKTLFALLDEEQQKQASGYFAVNPNNAVSPQTAATLEIESLVICEGNIAEVISELEKSSPRYGRLRETSLF